MVNWNVIEHDFNTEDQTVNFGARGFGGENNLYESCTLASIKSDQICDNNPKTIFQVKANKLFYAIDSTLVIFSDLICSNVELSIILDEICDTLCITKDAKYAFLGLRDGSFKLLDVEEKTIIIESNLLDILENQFFLYSHLHISTQNQLIYFIVTTTGDIFRLEINNYQSDCEFKNILLHQTHIETKIVAFNYPFILLNGPKLVIYNIETNELLTEMGLDIVNSIPYGNNMFLTLHTDGNFILICTKTLNFFTISQTPFKDFIYINQIENKESLLLTISKPDEIGVSYLKSFGTILNINEPTFMIKHTDDIHLIVPESIQDDQIYVTTIKNDGIVVEFRIHLVQETVKEVRFERLLKRHKFDEAEMFAKIFNLDRSLIVKGRANALISKRNFNTETIQELFKMFDDVDDVEFKLNCCYDMYGLCTNVEDVRCVLEYGVDLGRKYQDSTEIESLSNQLSDVLNKLEIFTFLQRYHINISWEKFSSCDTIKFYHEQLLMENMEIAAVLLNRLDLKLSKTDIIEALNILDKLPWEFRQRFLYVFISISVRNVPSSITIFTEWMLKKVFLMEKEEFSEFPHNAIEFINELTQLLFKENESLSESQLFWESFNNIKMLLESLNRLEHLSTTYNINISLEKYLHDSDSLISTFLLLWIKEDDFKKFYDDFLCRFIVENNLQPDDVLLKEIDQAMNYKETYIEVFVQRYLDRINSIEKKLEAIQKIGVAAKVPWSEFVRKITNSSLQYDHPLREEILKLIKKEPQKAVLMKYNLQQYIISNSFVMMNFVINRILYCNQPTMIDDIFTLCITSDQKQMANFMLFQNLVNNRRIEDAFKFLDRIQMEDWIPFCNAITNSIVNGSKRDFNSIEKFSSFIPIIKRKYKEKVKNYSYNKRLDNLFVVITSYFNTKRIYKEVQVNDLLDSKKSFELLNVLTQNAFDDFEDNNSDLNLLDSSINDVAKCFKNIKKSEVILKFLTKCNNLDVINKYAEDYYYYVDDSKELFELGLMIIHKMNIDNLMGDVTCLDLTISSNAGNISTLIANVVLAQKLFVKAMINNTSYQNQELENSYLLVKSFFGTITQNLNVKTRQELFLIGNGIENVTPTTRTFSSINDMLGIFVGCEGFRKSTDLKYLSNFSDWCQDLVENDLNQTLMKIHTTLKNLYMEGHVLTVYNILIFFIRNLDDSNQEIIQNLQTLIKQQCIPRLLEKIFCAKVIDDQFALTLLLSLDFVEFTALIKNYIRVHKANPAKLIVIMQLTKKVFQYNNATTPDSYIKLLLLSKWWLKINGCEIQMKTFFVSPAKELMKLLFTCNQLRLEMMEEFCKDFNLDLQMCYLIYLEKLITNWKPDYEIIKDTDGKLQLVLKSTENELFKKCDSVLNLITSTEMLPSYIEKISSRINFYYYESFMCVFKILAKLTNNTNFNKQQLLIFLNNYRRINKPGRLELEEWFGAFPVHGSIDELSNFRLPFSQMLFTEDVWHIIRPEINIKTYTTWFKAIPFLHKSLNIDDICTFVVKEVVSSGILNKKIDDKNWILIATHENLFKEIEECVKNIVDVEKATSAINHLMIHTPNGADKVNASFMCLEFAKKYKQITPHGVEGVDDAYNKIRNKYLKYSVCQVLHSCRLNSEDYSKILLQPHDLIESLYIDKSIETFNSTVMSSIPDINKAVDKISDLHNIDILKKRKELLEGFLSANTDQSKFSKDVMINLKRAAYICQSGDLFFWQTHLANLGTGDEDQLKLKVKGNALRCLTMISDVETVEMISDLEYKAFLNYIDKIYLLSDLENRGFSMTLDQLNGYNKKVLLRQLAQDIYYSNTIKIIADICIIYSILDVKYWNKIVDVSIKLNMYDDLKHYIQFWSMIPSAKYKNFYINAWQYVVDNLFNDCVSLNKSETFEYWVKCIGKIQSCPVLKYLKFEKVFKKLLQMDMFEVAVVFTQYMAEDILEDCLKELMDYTERVNVSELRAYGIYGIDLVEDILANRI